VRIEQIQEGYQKCNVMMVWWNDTKRSNKTMMP